MPDHIQNKHNVLKPKVACLVFNGGDEASVRAVVHEMVKRDTCLALICDRAYQPKAKKFEQLAIAHQVGCLIIVGNPRNPAFANNALRKIQRHYQRLDYYFDLTTPTKRCPLPNYHLMGKAFQQITA